VSFNNNKLIIEGITEDGKTFRPSDWIERLCGSVSSFGADRRSKHPPRDHGYRGPERRLSHVNFLHPQIIDGIKCLVVDLVLCEANPAAYQFLMDFVTANRLRTRDYPQLVEEQQNT
jgi:hypothetical protein